MTHQHFNEGIRPSSRPKNRPRNPSDATAPVGYYSSLVASRNFLRFSFAPHIPFPPFPQRDLRYMPGHVHKMRYRVIPSSLRFFRRFFYLSRLSSRGRLDSLSSFLRMPLIPPTPSLCRSLVRESLAHPPRALDLRCASTGTQSGV